MENWDKIAWIVIVVQVAGIILKVTNQVTWDWIWVISPLWIFGALCAVAFIVSRVIIRIFAGIDT